MITVLTALFREAAPLIQSFSLKKDTSFHQFQVFRSSASATVPVNLVITGTGVLPAAVSAASFFTACPPEGNDFAVNFGMAAGVRSGRAGVLYLMHSIYDTASRRSFYPDLLYDTDLPEAALITSPVIYRAGDEIRFPFPEDTVLLDMEGAGLYTALSRFFTPDRMFFLKYISDRGDLPAAAAVDKAAAHAASAAIPLLENLSCLPEKGIPREKLQREQDLCSRLSRKMHCSVEMEHRLTRIIHWCLLSGTDLTRALDILAEKNLLPCATRREGKKALQALEETLLC